MDGVIGSSLLARWANFYVIVGSSAAGLTGLQFVVIALAAGMRQQRKQSAVGIDAFSTPTIVYFSTALFLAAALSAPWNGLVPVAFLFATCGAAGTCYCLVVARRTQQLTAYKLVLEDWIWHIVLPLVTHLALLAAGLALPRHPSGALFTIAAALLLLLFIGIHNAWDTVTFLVVYGPPGAQDDEERPAPPPPEAGGGEGG
jgi:hypothetical protein